MDAILGQQANRELARLSIYRLPTFRLDCWRVERQARQAFSYFPNMALFSAAPWSPGYDDGQMCGGKMRNCGVVYPKLSR